MIRGEFVLEDCNTSEYSLSEIVFTVWLICGLCFSWKITDYVPVTLDSLKMVYDLADVQRECYFSILGLRLPFLVKRCIHLLH